ncbi:hypothetical protein TNIN_178741 [Trichonephila inaurata madagascariensis]|uniref:Uncharacterized protein n=1 Tax=Trichonephila inaurata madagascariensis TaxID=2747483 RepID=A0A8X6XRF8_9ARAC|nr:hypothetical protein TNIN_178741 [Trichonephila inaurata madagascariensis]
MKGTMFSFKTFGLTSDSKKFYKWRAPRKRNLPSNVVECDIFASNGVMWCGEEYPRIQGISKEEYPKDPRMYSPCTFSKENL